MPRCAAGSQAKTVTNNTIVGERMSSRTADQLMRVAMQYAVPATPMLANVRRLSPIVFTKT